jgi:N-ethylmaleimide reductase
MSSRSGRRRENPSCKSIRSLRFTRIYLPVDGTAAILTTRRHPAHRSILRVLPHSLSGVPDSSPLLTTTPLGPWTLAHRIVVAPPRRHWSGQSDGSVTQEMVDFYGERASPGGLMISEAAAVADPALWQGGGVALFSAGQANAWRALVERVHARGATILAQLWHAGRVSTTHPATSSPLHRPEPPSDEFMETVIDQYRQAAEHAADAGFDGVELHATGEGLSDLNLRDEAYAHPGARHANLERRSAFLVDAVQAVASVWGGERIGVRLSHMGHPEATIATDHEPMDTIVARNLNSEGVAFVHIVNPTMDEGASSGARWNAVDALRLRSVFAGALLASGGYDLTSAEVAVMQGLADALALDA